MTFGRALFVIVLGALALRVGYVLTVTQFDNHFYDATFYEGEARIVAEGHGFVNPFPSAGRTEAADHPPLTVLVLLPAAKLPGDRQLWMRFTMTLLGVAAVAVIALLGRAVAGETVGLVAGALAAVYPNLWMNDGLIMSETLSALTTVAAVLLAYRLLRRPTLGVAAVLGAVCGLAALSRAELALLVPLLALPAAWVTRRDDAGARWRGVGAVLGAAAVVVAPWIVFNFTRFDEPTFLSTGDGNVVLGANCDATYYGGGAGLWNAGCLPAKAPHGDESVVARIYRDRGFRYARDHTGRLPVVAAARLGRLLGVYTPGDIAGYNTHEGRPRWASYLGLASFLALVPLAVGGARWLRRRRVKIWPLLAPVWLVLGSAVVFYGTPRFRVPAEPILVVLAAVGITVLAARHRPSLSPVVSNDTDRQPSAIEASSSS